MKYILLLLTCASIAQGAILQSEFQQLVGQFRTIYTPQVQNDLGLTLRLEEHWLKRSIFVASQARRIGQEAVVIIDGELAQAPASNAAAFVLTLCHEFGHIYGDTSGESKLLKEGRADYWAASCAEKFYSTQQLAPPAAIPAFLAEKCSTESCRQVAAGIVAFAATQGLPLAEGIDPAANDRARSAALHPPALCRVKTMIAGLFREPLPACLTLNE